ncbi:MAG: hypothetical protein JKY26_01675 [Pseudomonas sp.]|nr:hypothetical protein [Pseudomonas sp.]
MALDYILANGVTINIGETIITVDSFVDFSKVTKADVLVVNSGQYLVLLKSGTGFNDQGVSTFTLEQPWQPASIVDTAILIFPTFQDVKETVEAMRLLGATSRDALNRLQEAGQGRGSYASLHHLGVLTPFIGTSKWMPPHSLSITKIEAYLDAVAVGGDVVLSIRKNGVQVETLTILAQESKATPLILDLPLLETDFITVNILTVGSNFGGENLTVRLTY